VVSRESYMQFKFFALVILAFAGTASAQEPWSQRPESRQETVLNEDGGQAFVVRPPATAAPLSGVFKPGGPIVQDLQQYSIFLGSSWADPALRSREARLSKLLVNIRDGAQMDEIAQAGINNRFAATFSLEKVDITGNRDISDLEIQGVLAGMLSDGSVTVPGDDAVFIVYLDPGLHSTLASLKADKHYMAYHAFFNASGARIHYAVVPFQSDTNAQYQTSLRTLIVAALHSAETPN
jgi:hypothetical protein